MYCVSGQGVDKHMMNLDYYYYEIYRFKKYVEMLGVKHQLTYLLWNAQPTMTKRSAKRSDPGRPIHAKRWHFKDPAVLVKVQWIIIMEH